MSRRGFTLIELLMVVTIIALIFFGSKHAGPKASGQPYFRESR